MRVITVHDYLYDEKFGQLRYVKTKNGYDFLVMDVAKIFGYRNSNCAMRTKVNEEDRSIRYAETQGGMQKVVSINEHGLCSFVALSEKVDKEFKNSFLEWLVLKGVLDRNYLDKFYITKTRAEIEFVDALSHVLEKFDIVGIKQYRCKNFNIDYYIPKLNIVVEYDENNHKYYDDNYDNKRQKEIENILKCKFIRVSESDPVYENVGIVLQHILKVA